jgi:predicted PilT family ATPase
VAPAVRTASDGSIQKALRQINQQAESTLVAMDNVIQETAQARAHETFGYTVETTDVKQLKFDSILTQSSSLNVEVGVTHYRAPGAAWGQYVVLFVVLDHGAPTREAKLAAPSRL